MAKGWDKESLRHSAAAKFGKAPPYRTENKMPAVKKQINVGSGTLFKINDKISVVARYEKTRNGFRHVADLYVNGELIDSAKVNYLNRTWEVYDFQTVLQKVIEKTSWLSDEEKKKGLEFAKDYENVERKRVEKKFGTIGAIAKMGEIFGQTEKEKNDWKTRMLKAGLGSSGLEMPEDWETLSEEEKKRRLDGVIGVLSEKKSGD